ncbi:winged helix-turn-helix domain-containing protein [Parvibacter caecicola]|uniref:Molybdate transport system regulatory protein n=1 Tax=Parvibacter caecicola TaxID=747645 RepID=A0A7W5D1Q5_9ACTN|nr:LysR family transcriptional regulator [Parvibacter caecicola]MBB3171277.1 molybdate transport system regulatory protein [Parvibacter caecicola]MCR2041155.1 LysR family transcriptional regulator [Parvibacter caecicola]RNL11652.1 ModE family transcriptional regulator [Parvibacter caecicola]
MGTLEELVINVRISIANPSAPSESMFGPGIAKLCDGVRELGSLNAAAKSMGMAYSKAWRIIKDTESTLGIQLLDRDGAHGSQLTEEGNRLLDVYQSISQQLQEDGEALYHKELGTNG